MEIVIVISVICIYFMPAVMARGKRNGSVIAVLNLFLGWTGVVWLALLIWACVAQTTAEYDLNQAALRKIANS